MMSIDEGMYFGLDDIATRIWALMERPIRVDEIRDSLLDEYAVESATCTRDVLAFLHRLEERKLIQVHGANS